MGNSHMFIHLAGTVMTALAFMLPLYFLDLATGAGPQISFVGIFICVFLAQAACGSIGVFISTVANKENALIASVLVVIIQWVVAGTLNQLNSLNLTMKIVA